MNIEQRRIITGLVEKLMAGEAREIYMKDKPPKINKPFNREQEVDNNGVKKRLRVFLEENRLVVNPESVKKYALKYLSEHEKVATANLSYKTLREKIERGEYDFNFIDWRKPCLREQ